MNNSYMILISEKLIVVIISCICRNFIFDMLVCNDRFGMFCPLQGSDNLGPSGEPGAKGEKGETGIPSTEDGVPGEVGLKGSNGDPGSSTFQTASVFPLPLY